ncbi:MAG: hypothetical protein IJ317_00900 [Clostridia bacterium]|nr:hypothetical protein [Clostridia bacterium]
MRTKITQYCKEIETRIERVHIACFQGMDKPLFLISDNYPGVWLEHVYDSVFYAKMHPERAEIAVNTVETFLAYQLKSGQFPCYIWNADKLPLPKEKLVGYGHIQECVSFAKMCLELYGITGDRELLKRCFFACEKWAAWLAENRMTTGRGLIEQFVGYDTGHDNSGRHDGFAHPYDHKENGEILNAAALPSDDGVTPVLAVDMNCNFYGTCRALSKMAEILGEAEKSRLYADRAQTVKEKLFLHCFDKDDAFFYDADRNGNKRKCRSSTLFHLFLEGVLDKEADGELIDEIYVRYLKNPKEFWTEYPFPAVSLSEKSRENHKEPNSWGYYSQALIALRCTLWMDKYGFSKDFDTVCEKWLFQWTKHYEKQKFAQELDPETGEFTACSEWYSSCMLLYLYAAKRLGYVD